MADQDGLFIVTARLVADSGKMGEELQKIVSSWME